MIFFKRKDSNFSKVNVVLPTTNVAIPISENVNVPILENIHSSILENVDVPILENVDIPIPENDHIPQTKFKKVDIDFLDYDPGTRKEIWKYHVNQRDDIRRAYIKNCLHQPRLDTYKNAENIIVVFKLLGLNIIQHGLNILQQKIQLIAYHALSFISQMGLWDKMHSLLVDLEIGKKLGAKIVIFKVI